MESVRFSRKKVAANLLPDAWVQELLHRTLLNTCKAGRSAACSTARQDTGSAR